jgi:hypothetical protein
MNWRIVCRHFLTLNFLKKDLCLPYTNLYCTLHVLCFMASVVNIPSAFPLLIRIFLVLSAEVRYQTPNIKLNTDRMRFFSRNSGWSAVRNIWDGVWYMRRCMIYETVYDIWEGVWYMRRCMLYETVYDIWDGVRYMRLCMIYETVYDIWDDVWYMRRCMIYIQHIFEKEYIFCWSVAASDDC